MTINELTDTIIGAAIEVHRRLGPGLLESTYEACLAFELADRGLLIERQKELPVRYKAVRVDCGYRVDLLVDERVVVEVKSAQNLDAIHHAQLLTYLRLSGHRCGLLINFNVRTLRAGVRRVVNSLPE